MTHKENSEFEIKNGKLVRYNGQNTTVIIPEGVKTIGGGVFDRGEDYHTVTFGVETLTIPEGVVSIEHYAFLGCSELREINLPESLISIGEEAFVWSALESLHIPKNVRIIGKDAFRECEQLESITVDEENPVYDSRENCNSLIETETGKLILGLNTKVPNGVKSIGTRAFSQTKLKAIQLPYGVETIENEAFSYCFDLQEITLPESLISIGSEAFRYCDSLKSIHIPKNVRVIGNDAFLECNQLESITVDEENPVYDSRENCNAIIETESGRLILAARNAKIPAGVKAIGAYSFYGTVQKDIQIPYGVETIEKGAFCSCFMSSISIPDSVTHIGEYAFYKCLGIPESALETPERRLSLACMFDHTMPDDFSGCSGLTEITIPKSVRYIGENAFGDCNVLKKVVIENGVTEIKRDTFRNCFNLESVSLPDSITNIEENAFHGCKNLKTIKIPESVKWIGEGAFDDTVEFI